MSENNGNELNDATQAAIDFQQPILMSAEVSELFAALAAAHGEMTDPPKNKVAKVPMKAGGTYTYKYADLADILKMARPVLSAHGLALLQFPVSKVYGAVHIITRIIHKSGQWLEVPPLILPVGDDKPQTLGSMITYGRRYAAAGPLGISPDEDEDGQLGQQAAGKSSAQGPKQASKPAPSQPPKQQQPEQDASEAPYDAKEHVEQLRNAFGFHKVEVVAAKKDCRDWLILERPPVSALQDAVGYWVRETAMGSKPMPPR